MRLSTIFRLGLAGLLLAACTTTWRARATLSSEITIKNNLVQTGRLVVSVDPTDAWFTTSGLKPGEQATRHIIIKNTGTVPVVLVLGAKKAAGYTTVYNALTLGIQTANPAPLFNGPLTNLTATLLTDHLAPDATFEADLVLSLPLASSNDVSDSYANITFTITATQAT